MITPHPHLESDRTSATAAVVGSIDTGTGDVHFDRNQSLIYVNFSEATVRCSSHRRALRAGLYEPAPHSHSQYVGIYPDRTARRDRDHRHPRRHAPAGALESEIPGQGY